MTLIDQVSALVDAVERQQATTAAVLATTQNAARLRADRPIEVGDGGVSLAWAGPGRLTGWTLANTAAAPATVTVRDSRDAHGSTIAVVTVPAGDSRAFSHHDGVSFGDGLHVTAPVGVAGVVWIGAES